jgi:hypothetical protein
MPQKCIASRTDRHTYFRTPGIYQTHHSRALKQGTKVTTELFHHLQTHTHTHKELLIKRLKRKECLTLTLSTTITSIEPLRIKVSTRLSACSPQSGCERSKFWVFTPIDSASDLSSACSASIKAQ